MFSLPQTLLLATGLLGLSWSLVSQYQKQKFIENQDKTRYERPAALDDHRVSKPKLKGHSSQTRGDRIIRSKSKSRIARKKQKSRQKYMKVAKARPPQSQPKLHNSRKKQTKSAKRERPENSFTYTDTVYVSGVLNSNLLQTIRATGESSMLLRKITDIFAWDIDFFKDIEKGDILEILVEKHFDNSDRFKGYGKVLAARYSKNDQEIQAFYFEHGSNKGYYAPSGSGLQKLLLKAPLEYTRVSSNFSYSRLHPILKVKRPHWGVDYAAPRGTPVYAAGEGRVAYAKWVSGYGKTIKIKHNGIYTTYYGHLYAYAKKLSAGDRVKQGQVIGYVGSTGMATGPHLDYRVERKGRYINPRKLTTHVNKDISPQSMPLFAAHVKQLNNLMLSDGLKMAMAGGGETPSTH